MGDLPQPGQQRQWTCAAPAGLVGVIMSNARCWIVLGALSAFAAPALAQSFRVQCPPSTITHPDASQHNAEPVYSAPTYTRPSTDYTVGRTGPVNGAIKCQQISGGDGYATMGDGTQTYLFSFGPLSGLADITRGKPATEFPSVFNSPYDPPSPPPLQPGDPATTVDGATPGNVSGGFVQPLSPAQLVAVAGTYNGAVGLAHDVAHTFTIYDISQGIYPDATTPLPHTVVPMTVTVILNSQSPFVVGDQIVIGPSGAGSDVAGYAGTFTVTAVGIRNTLFADNFAFQYTAAASGLAEVTGSSDATASSAPAITGHVDPRQIMDVGVMNGNIPAPLMAIDEDDEFFLTLTNVGMIMRPDLFEQHTVHFHGYPNASAFYDGVPDASVAINIAASFTYYYLAPDAGTYFWHCHITPPEHLQMGMVGQLYVRPRQNRVAVGSYLYDALTSQQRDLRTACSSASDILCSHPLPALASGVTQTVPRAATGNYAYNDGDGTTFYDVEYPLQIHGFDPNFHFVGMTFNPEGFTHMNDKNCLLTG